MPADIELSADTEQLASGCAIMRMQPGRISGRSEQTGIYVGELTEGLTFWAGTWSLVQADKSDEDAIDYQGEVEAALMAYETQQKTLRVRVGTHRGRSHIEFLDRNDNEFDPPSATKLTTTGGGMRFSLANAAKILIYPGFWFTHDDKLYIYSGTSALDVHLNNIRDCVPAFANTGNGEEIEFRNPYLLARFPQSVGTVMNDHGDGAGPWDIPFEEAV